MADIDNKTRKFAANNPQVTLQEGMKISFDSQPAAPGLKKIMFFFTICKTNLKRVQISNFKRNR